MKSTSLLIGALGLALLSCSEQPVRTERYISDGWQFSRDGQEWSEVAIPHDWAISGPFDKKWDLQIVAIEQNGENEATEKSGRSGALPWIGEGQYKTSVFIDKHVTSARLIFDGAMSEPIVYVNGSEAGRWAYGYNAFEVDMTPFMKVGEKNDLLVKLQNVEESSRWYPGAGIYRHVTLVTNYGAYLDDWGTFVRTKNIAKDMATLAISAKAVDVPSEAEAKLVVSVADEEGHIVSAVTIRADSLCGFSGTVDVPEPELWTPENPYLYSVSVSLSLNDSQSDVQTFKTGIRTVSVTKENGFQLNGKTRKIKGVCLHHDLGPLGAAENKAAFIRQIKIMKDMGADAIRTAHNMPSRMQMDVCDSLGMMVMAESFDMWIYPKCKNGYARFFNEWSDKDIANLVRRHRNHPSIIMWSIGNEIPEQGMAEGPEVLLRLQNLCHSLDETRPVTQGMDRIYWAIKNHFAQLQDVVGMNYRVHLYEESIDSLPQGVILGSETASTVSSRGVYKFPVEVSDSKVYDDAQCSSYDTEYCSWSNIPEDDFVAQDDLDYTIGQFVWTGFDYLGEPTPYDSFWPSRSSYFGICDLAGLPKDRYYLYRSQWNTAEHTTHLLPHWSWPGREGQVTPIYCYTDAPTAELFLNGKSQGKISKNKDVKLDRYRLRWNNVVYEPGELAVVAYDANGRETGRDTVRTAGAPARVVLKADKSAIVADGADLAYITVSLADKNGNFIPTSSDKMTIKVSGAGVYQASCNGDATSLTPFVSDTMNLFSGKLVTIVRSTHQSGPITVSVTDEDCGLSAQLTLLAQ